MGEEKLHQQGSGGISRLPFSRLLFGNQRTCRLPLWKLPLPQRAVIRALPVGPDLSLSLEYAALSAHILNDLSNKFLTPPVHFSVPCEPTSETVQSFAYSPSGGPAMLLGVAVFHFPPSDSICAPPCRYKNISKTLGSSQRYNSKSEKRQ